MKLTFKQGNNILGTIGIIGGIVIVALAFVQELPFMKNELPGSGFFPILCGIAISIFGVLIIVENTYKSRKAAEESPEDSQFEKNIINMTELRTFAYTIGISILVLVMTPIIGIIISIGIAVTALVKILAKENMKKSLIIGIGTTIVLYLIFSEFLGVPLPRSIIGI